MCSSLASGVRVPAAIEAADNDASVTILRRRLRVVDQQAVFGRAVSGWWNEVQKAVGYDDSADDVYGYLMDSNGPQADPEKVRAYADGGADHLDWLMTLGVPFKMSSPERAMMALTDDCLLYTGSEKAWPYVDKYKPAPAGTISTWRVTVVIFVKILTEAVEQRTSTFTLKRVLVR